MARSHPPTLIRLAERTLLDECGLAPGTRLLVAVSGGGDSSALLHVLAFLAPRLGLSLVAHGVDHGLRDEAEAELALVAELADRLGVPFEQTRLELTKGGNVQARARIARYDALHGAAARQGAHYVATAHHQDDRAETVLIRLLHGATPDGLAVLPAIDGRLVRPLIRARKADVVRHLERHRISHAEDPSNKDPRFLRVRVRREVMPLLEQLSAGIVNHLTALADDLESPPPSVIDDGEPVALRRAHVQVLRRALRLGRPARVAVGAGRTVVVDPKGDGLRVDRDGGGRTRKDPERGGAKPAKSG